MMYFKFKLYIHKISIRSILILNFLPLTVHYGRREYSISKDLDDNILKAHSLYTFFEKMQPLNRTMN